MAAPRVLIVDDTPANLIALSAVLRPLGAELVEARSGADAVELAATGSFAVALMDVQMPSMDGFEAAARIRATPAGRDLPILFLTAIHRDETFVRKGYAVGAADYITKPYDADVVRARVKAFVDLFRQREELRRRDVALRTRERDVAVRQVVAFERIATAALEEGDVGAMLQRLLSVFLEAADSASSATILLCEGQSLRVRATAGDGLTYRDGDMIPIGEGFAGTIAAKGEPVAVEDAPATLASTRAWPRGLGVRRLYGVPLLHDGDVIGVAHIGSTEVGPFSDVEKHLFLAVAERAAWAVAARFRLDRFHSVLMAAPVVVSILRTPDYKREFGNLACRRLFGGREVVGLTAGELGASSDVLERLDRVVSSGETQTIDEHAVSADWTGTGHVDERHFNVTLQPLRGSLGRIEGVLSFSIDVTSQVVARRDLERAARERAVLLESERAARAEAEQANRAKDDFLATVSHELRTPLNAILGWTVIAQRSAPVELQRALSVIERNARTQTRIIEDVLDVSRIISGNLRLALVSTDVGATVLAAVEAVRPSAEAKALTLAVSIGEVGAADADPERLQQVIWNVLSNAIKFTPTGGRIEIDVRGDRETIVIRVRDTGEGIDPGFLPHVFEPFRQADGSTTRRHGGLGLGLAIVKQLVLAHGGTIVATSEGENLGSTFTIGLPKAASAAAAPRRLTIARDTDRHVRLDGVRVLVVDDQEDARSLLKEVLTERGAEVTCAGSAGEALDRIPTLRPHVLLSDVGMPELDGIGFIRRVRLLSAERGGTTPAIALTAYANADHSQKALAAGFQFHLAKPVDPATVVSFVARLTSEGRANDGAGPEVAARRR